MSFDLKPKATYTASSEAKVDWKGVADTVMGTSNSASRFGRVSVIVDLGEQVQDLALGKQQATIVDTEAEADALLAHATSLQGKEDKHVLTKELVDGKYHLNFNIYQPKNVQEVAVMVDVPSKLVDYGNGEKMPYRLLLNGSFMGDLKGFQMKAVKPKVDGLVWTFAPNNKLSKIALAVGEDRIVSGKKEDNDVNMNVGLLLGKALQINIKRKGDFLSAGDLMGLPEEVSVGELPYDAIGVSFDNATAELLEKAKLRKVIIDKIKKAVNYTGSNMEKAVVEYEAKFGGGNAVVQPSQAPSQQAQQVAQQVVEGALDF